MKYIKLCFTICVFIYFTGSSAYENNSMAPSPYHGTHYEYYETQGWHKIGSYPIYLSELPLKKDIAEWNKIDYSLYLGELPLEKNVTDLGITWVQHGMESLARALEQGHTVYISSATDPVESASVVIAYLMQYQMFPYDDAFALVQNGFSTIHLNEQQRQLILDCVHTNENPLEDPPASWATAIQDYLSSYFQQANDITEDKLAQTLDSLFYYAVEGTNSSELPPSIADWIPQVEIESTLSLRNRYLLEFSGDQEKATAEAIQRSHTYFTKMQLMALGVIPFIGSPARYSLNLWYQLREICLIAALHNHDLHAPEVKVKIMSALVGSRTINAAVNTITKTIAKEILVQAGAGVVPGAILAMPLKMAFNYFNDNATKVSEHAQVLFGGEHSLPITEAEYLSEPTL